MIALEFAGEPRSSWILLAKPFLYLKTLDQVLDYLLFFGEILLFIFVRSFLLGSHNLLFINRPASLPLIRFYSLADLHNF